MALNAVTPFPNYCILWGLHVMHPIHACMLMCVHAHACSNYCHSLNVWSQFSLRRNSWLVALDYVVSHATFATLYQAIVERMSFWQNGWIVRANENELSEAPFRRCWRRPVLWHWQWSSASHREKLLKHWCSDLHDKPLCNHLMKFGGTDFVLYSSTVSGYSAIYPVTTALVCPYCLAHLLWSSRRSISCHAFVVDTYAVFLSSFAMDAAGSPAAIVKLFIRGQKNSNKHFSSLKTQQRSTASCASTRRGKSRLRIWHVLALLREE